MARVLKKDKNRLYSKLQKHTKMLTAALEECEDILRRSAQKEGNIKLSANSMDLYYYIYSCEEYANFLKLLIDQDVRENEIPQCLSDLFKDPDCREKNLVRFVPSFLRNNLKEHKKVSGQTIIMGLKLEDLHNIRSCIKDELVAHSRGKANRNLKKRKHSCIEQLDESEKIELRNLKHRQFSVVDAVAPTLMLALPSPVGEVDFFTQSLSASPKMFKETDMGIEYNL